MIATVVIAWTATTTIHAAIIVRSGGGVSAAADARANRIPMENGKPVIGGEADGDNDSRSDLGTVTTVTVGAAASVSGASATSGSSVSATVTADTAADTLEIVAAGSTSLFAASNAPTPDSSFSSNANGNSFFAQGFDLTERSYEYTLSADTEVSVTQTQAGSEAKAFIRLLASGTSDPLIDQRIDELGLLFSTGSLSGVLAPGQYAISGHSGGSYWKGQADATFALLLELTAASRWIDPAGGTFRVADNWEASIVPGVADVAVFDLPGTYTVQLDQDTTNKRLRANGAAVNVSFDLNGNDYVLDEIRIGGLDGDSVSVAFTDTSGPIVSAALATADDGLAPAVHEGSAAHLRALLMEAGKGGFADVDMKISTTSGRISSGGRVDVKGPKGHWDVQDLAVGTVSTGLLEVSSGGVLTSQRAVLGDGSVQGATFVAVRGQHSSWDNNETLVVGKSRGAVLLIEDHAIVTSREIEVGSLPESVAMIEVSDATLLHSGFNMSIGVFGTGTLRVINSALVEANSLRIKSATSSFSPGNGRVTAESLGELRVAGVLSIGTSGEGRLTINGGRVEQINNFLGRTDIGQRGIVEVLDGHFHEGFILVVNGELALNTALGSASVGINKVENPGRLTVGPGGHSEASGA
jgi:T5SS/PEP-CTERM-associated repeat protein